jgi:hypothetical protein
MGSYLEAMFANSRCDSQFAHFCLFVLLVFLFYSFAEGVLEELNKQHQKDQETF